MVAVWLLATRELVVAIARAEITLRTCIFGWSRAINTRDLVKNTREHVENTRSRVVAICNHEFASGRGCAQCNYTSSSTGYPGSCTVISPQLIPRQIRNSAHRISCSAASGNPCRPWLSTVAPS